MTANAHAYLEGESPLVQCRASKYPAADASNLHKIARISNVCQVLEQAFRANEQLEIFLSPSEGLLFCYCPVKPFESFELGLVRHETITLKHILSRISFRKSLSRIWTLMQRMSIALTLASSLLQLCSTPWLPKALTDETVCFQRAEVTSGASFAIEADQPFLVHNLQGRPRIDSGSAVDIAEPLSIKRQLLELGIVLLGIWHQALLESWSDSTRHALDNTYESRYTAVSRRLVMFCHSIMAPSFAVSIATLQLTPIISPGTIDLWKPIAIRSSDHYMTIYTPSPKMKSRE